jgi:Glycosyl transferase family 2
MPEPPQLAILAPMSSRAHRWVRTRMWPTRRLFEGRHRELSHALTDLRERVSGLHTELAALSARQEQMFVQQAELVTRLRRTQALTARTYEAQQGWETLLAAARDGGGYEAAYEDPEPLISIPIPTFNSPETLCSRALASVQAQTHTRWEALVVGDHCTDDTEERVLALGDPRIRFVNLPVRENDPADPWERWAVRGSVPRAMGIELAAGSWIAPLSHDDAWDPDHLAALLEAARASRAEVVYSRMRIVLAGDPGRPQIGSCGAWPPALGAFAWQSAMFHGGLRFLRYDRTCALASEPNDWNLARRAWDAGVRFRFLDRETSTLHRHAREEAIEDEYAARGLPSSAAAYP